MPAIETQTITFDHLMIGGTKGMPGVALCGSKITKALLDVRYLPATVNEQNEWSRADSSAFLYSEWDLYTEAKTDSELQTVLDGLESTFTRLGQESGQIPALASGTHAILSGTRLDPGLNVYGTGIGTNKVKAQSRLILATVNGQGVWHAVDNQVFRYSIADLYALAGTDSGLALVLGQLVDCFTRRALEANAIPPLATSTTTTVGP